MSRIEEEITLDHNEIRTYYANWNRELNATPSNHESARKWYNQFVWAVARHSVAEEVVLYPLYESKLGEWGKTRASVSREEHREIKILLKQLEEMSKDAVEFVPRMHSVMDALNKHMEHEEREELPRLIQHLDESERISAGKSFERRKMLAPTHPHPNAPDSPYFETLVGMLTLPFDKMKDLFRDFPSKAEIDATRPLEAPVI